MHSKHHNSSIQTVAQQLQNARKAQHLSIEEVANLTKLRTDHIRALESGRYRIFSAPIYIRGFTKTYAKSLKLDVQKVLDALSDELEKDRITSDDSHPIPLPKTIVDHMALLLSRIDWKIAFLIFLIFSLIFFSSLITNFFQHQKGRDHLENLGEGIYSFEKPLPSSYLPLPEKSSERSQR